MADLFQERFRELPIFQRLMNLIENHNERNDQSLEELVTRLLIASENGLNWDTLCMNCGVLMDENYAKYCEIEQLKQIIANPITYICQTCGRQSGPAHYCNPDF